MLLSPDAVRDDLDRLSRDGFCADPIRIARDALALLTPPERISTTDCAARYRKFPAPEGGGTVGWSPTLTPYINGIQDDLDDPRVERVVVIKPGRVGGTVAAENHLLKRMMFGPMTDVLWYLGAGSEVDSYVGNVVTPLFDLHPEVVAKLSRAKTENKLRFKKVGGRKVEYLPVNKNTITNRQAGFIVGDEIDTIRPSLRGTFAQQVAIRGRTLGSRRKSYLCSHPDLGWTTGIGAAWKETSRGLFWWPCTQCAGWSSPCPPARWRTIVDFDRREDVSDDEYLDTVAATAVLVCPHCGGALDDADKSVMLSQGRWVHEGQTIAEDGTVTGEPRNLVAKGFWIHGTMSPFVKLGELAREVEGARRDFARTRKPERLREVTAKVLGEVYEGATGTARELDPVRLEQRSQGSDAFAIGTVPADVMFVTAAVDVGKAKFDIGFWGWDLEGRSWLIDRATLRQRRHDDGVLRDLRPAERIDDWDVLRREVLDRQIAIAGRPGWALPVAAVAVDTGGAAGKKLGDGEHDAGATWKAREFARRMAQAGYSWGSGQHRWERVRLIKGAASATAPELPDRGRQVSLDEQGRLVAPVVLEWVIGVSRLKALSVERLAVTDGGPGQCRFASGLPQSVFAEFSGEVLVDGTWERRGPNETLDLFGYAEAARLMLRTDRADLKWDAPERRPVWARPIGPEQAKPADAPKKETALSRMAALNRRN